MTFEHKPRGPLADQANLSDYEWLAFQYLSDELNSQQRTEFEEALATVPAAAEAFQAMVAISQQLLTVVDSHTDQANIKSVASLERKAIVGSGAPSKTVRWLAALAAAVLLVIGLSQLFAPIGSDSKLANQEADVTGDQMAELWASIFGGELVVPSGRDEIQNFLFDEAEFVFTTATEESTESESAEEDWLYSLLVSLESTEDWPTEEQGGS